MLTIISALFALKNAPDLPAPLIIETEKYLKLFAPFFMLAGTLVFVVYALSQLL